MKSPNKYMSLSYLVELQENNYINPASGKEYLANEVDMLIWEKQEIKDEERINRMIRDYNSQEE